jgi:hypothetical protein
MLTIRIMPELQAALDAMPSSDVLTFLLTETAGRSSQRRHSATSAQLSRRSDWGLSKVDGLQLAPRRAR